MKIRNILFILIGLVIMFFIAVKFFNKPKEIPKQESDVEMELIEALHKRKMPLLNYDIQINSAKKFKTDKLQLFVIDDFLTKSQCEKLCEVIKENQTPSKTTDGPSYHRTSNTSNMVSEKYGNLVELIDNKMSLALQIPLEYSERIQGQHYRVGQEFKAHTDWFEPGLDEYKQNCKIQGNRTWTFMIYLNDVEEGGETYFESINHKFKPKMGQAVIWNNLNCDGSINRDTIHSGEPVIKGEKFIITKWFRKFSK